MTEKRSSKNSCEIRTFSQFNGEKIKMGSDGLNPHGKSACSLPAIRNHRISGSNRGKNDYSQKNELRVLQSSLDLLQKQLELKKTELVKWEASFRNNNREKHESFVSLSEDLQISQKKQQRRIQDLKKQFESKRKKLKTQQEIKEAEQSFQNAKDQVRNSQVQRRLKIESQWAPLEKIYSKNFAQITKEIAQCEQKILCCFGQIKSTKLKIEQLQLRIKAKKEEKIGQATTSPNQLQTVAENIVKDTIRNSRITGSNLGFDGCSKPADKKQGLNADTPFLPELRGHRLSGSLTGSSSSKYAIDLTTLNFQLDNQTINLNYIRKEMSLKQTARQYASKQFKVAEEQFYKRRQRLQIQLEYQISDLCQDQQQALAELKKSMAQQKVKIKFFKLAKNGENFEERKYKESQGKIIQKFRQDMFQVKQFWNKASKTTKLQYQNKREQWQLFFFDQKMLEKKLKLSESQIEKLTEKIKSFEKKKQDKFLEKIQEVPGSQKSIQEPNLPKLENKKSAWGSVPHPNKLDKGGEDAMFASTNILVVADGVSGWSQFGIDSGLYSKKLMEIIEELWYSPKQMFYMEQPHELAIEAVQKNEEKGSSTLTILTLHPDTGQLRSYHIGDSIFGLFNENGESYIGFQQQSEFNVPFQVFGGNKNQRQFLSDNLLANQVSDVFQGHWTQFSHEEVDKSLLVVASDGLWDNIHHQQIHSILFDENELQLIGKTVNLMNHAQQYSRFQQYESPFYCKALRHGINAPKSGKIDDTVIIVAEIESDIVQNKLKIIDLITNYQHRSRQVANDHAKLKIYNILEAVSSLDSSRLQETQKQVNDQVASRYLRSLITTLNTFKTQQESARNVKSSIEVPSELSPKVQKVQRESRISVKQNNSANRKDGFFSSVMKKFTSKEKKPSEIILPSEEPKCYYDPVKRVYVFEGQQPEAPKVIPKPPSAIQVKKGDDTKKIKQPKGQSEIDNMTAPPTFKRKSTTTKSKVKKEELKVEDISINAFTLQSLITKINSAYNELLQKVKGEICKTRKSDHGIDPAIFSQVVHYNDSLIVHQQQISQMEHSLIHKWTNSLNINNQAFLLENVLKQLQDGANTNILVLQTLKNSPKIKQVQYISATNSHNSEQLNRLKQEISYLKSQLSNKQLQLDQNVYLLQDDSKINQLQGLWSQEKRITQQLKTKIYNLERNLKDMSEDKADLQLTIKDLEQQQTEYAQKLQEKDRYYRQLIERLEGQFNLSASYYENANQQNILLNHIYSKQLLIATQNDTITSRAHETQKELLVSSKHLNEASSIINSITQSHLEKSQQLYRRYKGIQRKYLHAKQEILRLKNINADQNISLNKSIYKLKSLIQTYEGAKDKDSQVEQSRQKLKISEKQIQVYKQNIKDLKNNIVSLKKENQEITQLLQNIQHELNERKNENEALLKNIKEGERFKERLNKVQREFNELSENYGKRNLQMDRLNQRISNLIEENKNIQEKYQHYLSYSEKLRTIHEEQKEKDKQIETKIKQMNVTIQNKNDAIEEMKKENEDATMLLCSIENDLQTKDKQCEQLAKALEQLQKANKSADYHCNQYKHQVSKLSDENNQLLTRVEQANNQIAALRQNLQNQKLQSTNLLQKTRQQSELMIQMQSQLEEESNRYELLSNTLANLQQNVKKQPFQEIQREIKQLKIANQHQGKRIKQLNSDNQALLQVIASKQLENNKLSQQNLQLATKLQNQENQFTHKLLEQYISKQAYQQMIMLAEQLRNNITSFASWLNPDNQPYLSSRLDSLKQQVQIILEKQKALNKQKDQIITKITQENIDLTNIVDELEKQLDQEKKKGHSKQIEQAHVISELVKEDGHNLQLIEQYKRQSEQYGQKTNKLLEQINLKNKIIYDFERVCHQYKQSLSKLEETKRQQQQLIQTIGNQIQEKQNTCSELAKELEKKQTIIDKQAKESQNMRQSLTSKGDEQLKLIQTDMLAKQKQLRQLKQTFQQQTKLFSQRTMSYQSKIQTLQKEIVAISSLKTTNTKLEQKIKGLEIEINTLTAEKIQLMRSNDHLYLINQKIIGEKSSSTAHNVSTKQHEKKKVETGRQTKSDIHVQQSRKQTKAQGGFFGSISSFFLTPTESDRLVRKT